MLISYSICLCLLSGGIENTFHFLFCPHAYLPSAALTYPYGLRQGLCAGSWCRHHNGNYTLCFLSTLTADAGEWNVG